VLFRNQRIAQLVGFVAILDDGSRQQRAFGNTKALCHGAGGDIPDDHFDRDDFDFPYQLLAHI